MRSLSKHGGGVFQRGRGPLSARTLDGARRSMEEALEIVPYDMEWPRVFSAERDRIAAALGALALRIDHNGSTSVPGLAAKPIVDIQVSVQRLPPIAISPPRF